MSCLSKKNPEQLGRAQRKHAREFKEAWYSIDGNTINRQVEIPTIYLQLKTTRKCPTNNNDTMTTSPQNNNSNIPMTPSLATEFTQSLQRFLQPAMRSDQPRNSQLDGLDVYTNVETPQNLIK
jgi:hypothetical protein